MSARRLADELIGAVHYEPTPQSIANLTYSVTERESPAVSPAPAQTANVFAEVSDHQISLKIREQRSKHPAEYLTHGEITIRLASARETLAIFTERYEKELAPKGEAARVELDRLTRAAGEATERSVEAARLRDAHGNALSLSFEADNPEAQAAALDAADSAEAVARKSALAAQGATSALERRGAVLRTSIAAAEITHAEIANVRAEVERLEAWHHAFELAFQMRKSLKRDIAKYGHEHSKAMRTIVGRVVATPSKSEIHVPDEYPRPTAGDQLDHGRMRENAIADRVDAERFKAQQDLASSIDD